MKRDWSRLKGPLGALLLLLLALVVAWGLLVRPVSMGFSETRAEIEQDREFLSKLRKAAAGEPALKRRYAQLTRRRDADRYTLAGESSALAVAALQDHVKSIAARHGAELMSTNVLPVAETQGVPTVMVNVSMRMDMDALQKLLYDLESGVPLVIVESATIQVPQAEQAAEAGETESRLIVQLDLKSFMRKVTRTGDADA